jgi:hypothetical protein
VKPSPCCTRVATIATSIVTLVLSSAVSVSTFAGVASACASAQGAVVPPESCAAVRRAVATVDAARLDADDRALVAVGTRHTLSPTDDLHRGIGAARRFLRQELEKVVAASDGRARLREIPFDHKLGRGRDDTLGHFVNFVLEVPGADASRGVWIASGHYDSRCKEVHDGTHDAPGADDDGSGTAVALELARVVAAATKEAPLAASVWLCAFDGEEYGLFGSEQLAKECKERGVAVEGMVTNDIVGASAEPSSSRLRIFSEPFAEKADADPFFRIVGGENDGASRQLARFAARVGREYVAGLGVELVLRRDRFGRGGDHSPFNKEGFAAVRFTEAVEDYHHQHEDVRVENGVQYGDLPQFVDFAHLARVAKLNLATVLEGAGAPPPPAWVHLEGAVKPCVTVAWSPVADAAGYRVRIRRTDAADWSESRFVAIGTTAWSDPNYTVDDWQFAVATIGADGRESPVRFPTAPPKPAKKDEPKKEPAPVPAPAAPKSERR